MDGLNESSIKNIFHSWKGFSILQLKIRENNLLESRDREFDRTKNSRGKKLGERKWRRRKKKKWNNSDSTFSSNWSPHSVLLEMAILETGVVHSSEKLLEKERAVE